MSAKDKLENVVRNVWLAGLGSIETSRETLTDSLDKAHEKSTELYNELLAKGEDIQNQLDQKVEESKQQLQDQRRKYFSTGNETQARQLEQLERLSVVIDNLTDKVIAIVEQRALQAAKKLKQEQEQQEQERLEQDKKTKKRAPVNKIVVSPQKTMAKVTKPESKPVTKKTPAATKKSV